MPTQDFDRDTPDQPRTAAPAGAAATPVASGLGGGMPVGVVEEVGNPSGQPAREREPDPAEAAFERLTGHRTDEQPATSSDDEGGEPER